MPDCFLYLDQDVPIGEEAVDHARVVVGGDGVGDEEDCETEVER